MIREGEIPDFLEKSGIRTAGNLTTKIGVLYLALSYLKYISIDSCSLESLLLIVTVFK